MSIQSKLSRRMLVLVASICVLSGLLTGLWISISAEREATTKLISSLEHTANRYEAEMDKEFARKTNLGVAIAELFRDSLLDPNSPRSTMDLKKGPDGALRAIVGEYGAYLSKRSEITPRIKHDIETMFQIGPKLGKMAKVEFHNFYYESAEGDFLFETPNDWPIQAPPDEDYKTYHALVAPAQNPQRKAVWKPVYFDGIQKLWMTSLRVPIYDGDRFMGAMGYDYILDSILKEVRDMDRVEGWCKAFLCTSTGDLIIHPDYMDKIQAASLRPENEAPLQTKNVANPGVAAFVKSILAQSNPSLDQQVFMDGDRPTYASVRTINELGWKLVLYTPQSSVTESLRGTQFKAFATSLALAILLAFLLSWGFRQLVLNRLAALATSARELGAGRWDTPLPPVQDDEIGSLTICFKEMADKLRELVTELEDRVDQRTAELATVNKELESFSYSVSHDLRAPLRAIDAFSLALLEDCGENLNDEGKKHLAIIRKEASRMGLLIDDLLNLARVSRVELKRETVDLSQISREIMNELRSKIPERAAEFIVQDGLQVTADPGLMRIVMMNLLSNAWKFSGKQTQSKIEVGREELNGRAVFFVRDNGAGFDMAYVGKLFGAFQRLHSMNEFEGTGIGLATVQRVIRRHGGEVWAEGALHKGATLRFTLSNS